MKKTTLVVLTLGVIIASCSNNGNEATVKDAEAVTIEKTAITTAFKTVKEGSYIDWRASHLGGVQKRYGKVSVKSAELLVNNSQLSNATVVADITSLTVDNFGDDKETTNKLRGHLMSADFFSVDIYPTAKFELTKLDDVEGEYNSEVTGNLTIKEATKSITFKANVMVSENELTIQSEDFSVDRTLWGLTYNVEGTEGVPVDYLIANDIGFTINLTVTK
ncbi:MAG: YceI family protein [Vicingus serpentipes]|nr:YceI family protein [Vicingus serpentipes]